MLTQDRLKELLHYDPETGSFTWIKRQSARALVGYRAGWRSPHLGYLYIRIDGKLYLAHRLVWLYMTGTWPIDQIDHANLDRTDNSWANIRSATFAQNNFNKPVRAKSGLKGVTSSTTKSKPWTASYTLNYKRTHIGNYKTKEEAHEAYCRTVRQIHGEYFRAA